MSPTKKPTGPIDIYVRVSRVAGREGDSFISPKEQEKRCRAQLEADGYRVGQIFVDLDESGGTQDRPAFNAVMERIRDGVSGGVVVAKLNRFGRTTRGVLDDIAEIESHGAVVLAVDEKLDTSTSIGRFVLRMFASISELELDRIRDGWSTVHASMIERGISSGRTPAGYRKNGDKRLVPNEELLPAGLTAADTVREAFRLRAEEHKNWHEIARFLTAQGLPTQKGNPWTASGARRLLASRTYLGEVRHGDRFKAGAHDALVDERTFRLANAKGKVLSDKRGNGPLLGRGLIRCGVCGAAMVRSVSSKRGPQAEYLRCSSQQRGHVAIQLGRLEPYVIEQALMRMELTEGEYVDVTVDPEIEAKLAAVLADIEELNRQLEDREISAPVYAKAAEVAETDRQHLLEAIEQGQRSDVVVQVNGRARKDRDAARQLLVMLVDPEAAKHASKVDTSLVPAARELLRETLGKVTVKPGRGSVDERVTIEK